ncbi:MAG: UDP-N-acetylglucosamine 1-carboxyvinyltransferase [Limnochordales bacterium]|nr:UDP-N-acetylglucosamine 1-carboxyvinyltransferase [Limnochordales bacterium]
MGQVLRVEGGQRLEGRVIISGAKNSAAAILPATTLTEEPCFLRHVPVIADVLVLLEILNAVGFKARFLTGPDGTARAEPAGAVVEVRQAAEGDRIVPHDLAKKLRASILFLGPLLTRFGKAKVALPGGCDIGSRPIDLHLKGLAAMGADIRVEHGFVTGQVPGGRLHGAEIYLDFPSVGATENIMMAATLADGQTVIHNPAKEPEIVDLATFLNSMGAQVRGAGTDLIRITGQHRLNGAAHTLIPDRIEAGTYLLAGLACGGTIRVENVIAKHLEAVIAKVIETGAEVSISEDAIVARGPLRPRAVHITTIPYPGFPTDLQPQFTAYLTRAEGTSVVYERVFENRFRHVDELNRLGACIKCDGSTAVIEGVPRLTGAPLFASDLRMAAALVIGSLMAEGISVIQGVEHLLRGYEDPVGKLRGLGARVELVEEGRLSELSFRLTEREG